MIALAGTIGAGKTSLTGLLADHLNSQAFYESVDDNKILPLFYKDPKKYGFLLQIYFLNRRLDEIKDSFGNDLNVLDVQFLKMHCCLNSMLIWGGQPKQNRIFTHHYCTT